MKTQTPIRPGSELAAEFWEHGRSESCPIYDMHGHMGEWYAIYFPRAQAAEMIRSMDAAGVKLLCFAHHAALLAPEVGNRPAVDAVRAFPDRLRAYMAINPQYPDIIERDLAQFDGMRDVFVGLKFLASYHQADLRDGRYRPALEFANERALPVLLHTWKGAANNGPEQVRAIAGRYERARFLCGHSFHDDWEAAVSVARDCPNTYLELTAVLGYRGVIDVLCEGAGSDRLLFGTDLPWFDEQHGLGALLSTSISDDDIHNICHRNAEKLLGL
ncbi:MAG: amidohydrolase family protein [Candidatus Brocadiaceae bacterium]|nr:amidohydrolase family protein [Candidatus Brocadiaceae bacterium]